MAGTTDKFSSNLELGLSSTPQGSYDVSQQADMDEHYNSTQTISQILSDAITARMLFLVGVSANMFIQIDSSGTECIGLPANVVSQKRAVGFVKKDVLPGQYAIVYSAGTITDLTSLAPGSEYFLSAAGAIRSRALVEFSAGFPAFYVGYALNETTLIVQNMAWVER